MDVVQLAAGQQLEDDADYKFEGTDEDLGKEGLTVMSQCMGVSP